MNRIGMNSNQLKLIALITMTVDHIGMVLLPQYHFLRIVGRLALPIYAYMIAEGCLHTRSMGRYFGSMALLALLCQGAYLLVLSSLYQCILVTFSMSIALIWLLRSAMEKRNTGDWVLFGFGVAGALFVTELLPQLLEHTGFGVDYGFLGVILPVLIYAAKDKPAKLCVAAVCLSLMALDGWVGQWCALLALPLLAMYDGTRGSRKWKYLFYIYYPAHLLVIWGAGFLLGRYML